ncbi:MAG: sel1 repeat family protein, partial [Thermoguttaceae bacterium]|nr:sel1 repeat family protein [Thermoguttaceae bacterium]
MTDTEKNNPDDERLRLKYNDALEKAEGGDPAAQLEVGRLLFEGVGVRRNRGEAARWFEKGFRACRKLAETGDADALFTLAVCYDDGTGVFRDDRKAT